MSDVKSVGAALRAYATYYDHGDGWKYTRSTGIRHIRYASDFTGHNKLWGRLKFAAYGLAGLGKRSWFRPRTVREWYWSIISTIRVRMWPDDHLPDGMVGGAIVHWEEDGEYIELVGPTVGVKVADFLEGEPGNPFAVAIAGEIERVRRLGVTRRDEEGDDDES